MRFTNEAKKLLAEFSSRTAQILLAMVLVGPYVTGQLRPEFTAIGIVGITISLLVGLLIAMTIKEE